MDKNISKTINTGKVEENWRQDIRTTCSKTIIKTKHTTKKKKKYKKKNETNTQQILKSHFKIITKTLVMYKTVNDMMRNWKTEQQTKEKFHVTFKNYMIDTLLIRDVLKITFEKYIFYILNSLQCVV